MKPLVVEMGRTLLKSAEMVVSSFQPQRERMRENLASSAVS
jgi:hypothetical protein